MIGVGLSLRTLRTLRSSVSGNPFLSLMSSLLSGASQLIAHPLDYGSMFIDRAGTTPVTAPGQQVGLVLDHGFTGAKPVLGPELVVNGDFSNGETGWSATTGSFSGGMFSTNPGQNVTLTQSNILVIGKSYDLVFDIVYRNAGTCFSPIGAITNAGNNFRGVFVATSTGLTFAFAGSPDIAIDNISVRELPGFHATAISDAARGFFAVVPETGRRNLLTHTEAFDNAVWSDVNAVGVADRLTANAGTHAAYVETAIANRPEENHTVTFIFAPTSNRHRYVWVADRGISGLVCATFDLDTVSVIGQNAGTTPSISTLSDGSVRCSITYTRPTVGTSSPQFALAGPTHTSDRPSLTWAGTEFLDAKGQFELGTTATPYQRVGTQFDVTEAGVRSLSYVAYNGVNTAYQTPVLPAPGVDKAQVFAGVRFTTLSTTSAVVELSQSVNTNNGAFILYGENNQQPRFWSKGTVNSMANGSALTPPITNVFTGLGDISGDSAILRVNGTQAAISASDQGTGNYNPSGTYRQFYGARNGTTFFFNGHHYGTLGPITRFGTNATADQIAAAEAYYAGVTGVAYTEATWDSTADTYTQSEAFV